MILILSQRGYEVSTVDVIKWLDKLGANYIRRNVEDFRSKPFSYQISNDKTHPSHFTDDELADINCVWYRRWHDYTPNVSENCDSNHTYHSLKEHLETEFWSASGALFSTLKDKKWLSHPDTVNPSKLRQLNLARQFDINVPDSLLTNSKTQLQAFKKQTGSIIMKAISNGTKLAFGDYIYQMYTESVTDDLIDQLPTTFPHSFFQKKIDKQFEIRSFYLNGQFYSMAIFSQRNEKTAVDFRKYDDVKPNRTVPFNLPMPLQEKLRKLLKALNLTTGSIDLILGADNTYYFLEVNPVGQFGMVSKPCNYNLEEKIARYLIDNDYAN